MVRASQKICCKEPTENCWCNSCHECRMGMYKIQKKIPFPREKTDAEPESGSSTTEISDNVKSEKVKRKPE